MQKGQYGFCGVRMNKNGILHTLNYGKSVSLTEEVVETDAIFHYMPGARTLSLGNIGCMLSCDFCQNWRTSQARFVMDKDVHEYTPHQVVAKAKERDLDILSWTYNDPVVWHEFVMDTSRLAHQYGLKNLYKSAFFISMEAVSQLCATIDMFSISIKTLDEKLYSKISRGWLPPVLEATKHVFSQGKHLEISNLMVTDLNDSENDARTIAQWVLENLSDEVPLHFVRFHPDYKYTHVSRTPIHRLVKARQVAMEMGIKYCYLGNIHGNEGTNTYCSTCGHLLIERYGLNTCIRGLQDDGCCSQCETPLNVVLMPRKSQREKNIEREDTALALFQERRYEWQQEIIACHIEVKNIGNEMTSVYYWRLLRNGGSSGPFKYPIHNHDNYRFVISKHSPDEKGIHIKYPNQVKLNIYDVLDRAHFPTI
jgi:pyruvate formate lyase activating enzyme